MHSHVQSHSQWQYSPLLSLLPASGSAEECSLHCIMVERGVVSNSYVTYLNYVKTIFRKYIPAKIIQCTPNWRSSKSRCLLGKLAPPPLRRFTGIAKPKKFKPFSHITTSSFTLHYILKTASSLCTERLANNNFNITMLNTKMVKFPSQKLSPYHSTVYPTATPTLTLGCRCLWMAPITQTPQ